MSFIKLSPAEDSLISVEQHTRISLLSLVQESVNPPLPLPQSFFVQTITGNGQYYYLSVLEKDGPGEDSIFSLYVWTSASNTFLKLYSFVSPVLDIKANARHIVLSFKQNILILNATDYRILYRINSSTLSQFTDRSSLIALSPISDAHRYNYLVFAADTARAKLVVIDLDSDNLNTLFTASTPLYFSESQPYSGLVCPEQDQIEEQMIPTCRIESTDVDSLPQITAFDHAQSPPPASPPPQRGGGGGGGGAAATTPEDTPEDPYQQPDGASPGGIAAAYLVAHSHSPQFVKFSFDGGWLLTASEEGKYTTVWALPSFTKVVNLRRSIRTNLPPLRFIAPSPDYKLVATSGINNDFYIFNTAQYLPTPSPPPPKRGFLETVVSLPSTVSHAFRTAPTHTMKWMRFLGKGLFGKATAEVTTPFELSIGCNPESVALLSLQPRPRTENSYLLSFVCYDGTIKQYNVNATGKRLNVELYSERKSS